MNGNLFEKSINVNNISFQILSVQSIIVGSGASALRTSIELIDNGIDSVAIVDDGSIKQIKKVTSGSQSFFSPTLTKSGCDSIEETAEVLHSSYQWDNNEALNYSIFSRAELYNYQKHNFGLLADSHNCPVIPKWLHKESVKFDAKRLFSGNGDVTKKITLDLEKQVAKLEKEGKIIRLKPYIPVSIIKNENKISGLLIINKEGTINDGIIIFSPAIIAAAGGFSSLYNNNSDTEAVFHGILIEEGIELINPDNFTFALVSSNRRIGINGPLLSSIPAVYSSDEYGNDEQNFLENYFKSYETLISAFIEKGVNWEFNILGNTLSPSNLIDYAIFRETEIKGRKVYFDYSKNMQWGALKKNNQWNKNSIKKSDYEWIKVRGGITSLPWQRVNTMSPLLEKKLEKQRVSLKDKKIEVRLSAIGTNGSFRSPKSNEGAKRGLFFVGEMGGEGTGTPLISTSFIKGQMSAVEIAKAVKKTFDRRFVIIDKKEIQGAKDSISSFLNNIVPYTSKDKIISGSKLKKFNQIIGKNMSEKLSIIRNKESIEKTIKLLLYITYECLDTAIVSYCDITLLYTVRSKALMALASASTAIYYLFEDEGSNGTILVSSSDKEENFEVNSSFFKKNVPKLKNKKIICSFNGEEFSFYREITN